MAKDDDLWSGDARTPTTESSKSATEYNQKAEQTNVPAFWDINGDGSESRLEFNRAAVQQAGQAWAKAMLQASRERNAILHEGAQVAWQAAYDTCATDGQRAIMKVLFDEFLARYQEVGVEVDYEEFSDYWNTRVNQIVGF